MRCVHSFPWEFVQKRTQQCMLEPELSKPIPFFALITTTQCAHVWNILEKNRSFLRLISDYSTSKQLLEIKSFLSIFLMFFFYYPYLWPNEKWTCRHMDLLTNGLLKKMDLLTNGPIDKWAYSKCTSSQVDISKYGFTDKWTFWRMGHLTIANIDKWTYWKMEFFQIDILTNVITIIVIDAGACI